MKNLMITIALAILLTFAILTKARSEIEGTGSPRMHVEPGDGGCVALIFVENTLGDYHNTETLDTLVGQVRVRYETVGGHNPNDLDIVTVSSLPPGVAAVPMEMELPDGEVGLICVYERASDNAGVS